MVDRLTDSNTCFENTLPISTAMPTSGTNITRCQGSIKSFTEKKLDIDGDIFNQSKDANYSYTNLMTYSQCVNDKKNNLTCFWCVDSQECIGDTYKCKNGHINIRSHDLSYDIDNCSFATDLVSVLCGDSNDGVPNYIFAMISIFLFILLLAGLCGLMVWLAKVHPDSSLGRVSLNFTSKYTLLSNDNNTNNAEREWQLKTFRTNIGNE